MLRHDRRVTTSSATWTSSSGDLADVSDADDVEDRNEFVEAYNRIAGKVGPNTPPYHRLERDLADQDSMAFDH